MIKKHLKLLTSVLLASALAIALCACGGTSGNIGTATQSETAEANSETSDAVTEAPGANSETSDTVTEAPGANSKTSEAVGSTEANADTEAEETEKTQMGPKLSAYFVKLDPNEIHMNYDKHTDYMDSTMHYDVHCDGDTYYSSDTTEVSGYTNTTITFIQDDAVYNLDPDDMTAVKVMDVSKSFFGGNLIIMDDLYKNISLYYASGDGSDYTEDTREADGQNYAVEIYPATEYQPELTFYFDESGDLVYCLQGPPVIEALSDMGETFFTIHSIDNSVDTSLFDMSAYEIQELGE